MLIQVEISSFAIDPLRNTPVLVLKESSGTRSLMLPIGPLEASTIAMESLKVLPEKPLTIDLVRLSIEQLGGSLTRVIISDLVEQSYLSQIQINKETTVLSIDCRPCDAIALALRCKKPIFVKDIVFDKLAGKVVNEKELLRKNISSIDTTEFGRFILE
jgi:bifunctional DNase/RNase